jgi:uncharacterized protein YbcI
VSIRAEIPVEIEIAQAVADFQKEQQGVGAERTEAHIVGDMVIVRSIGCFTATERALCRDMDGRKLVKSARRELRSLIRKEIEARVASIVGYPVLRSFWDLDIRLGEEVEVYVLDRASDERLSA